MRSRLAACLFPWLAVLGLGTTPRATPAQDDIPAAAKETPESTSARTAGSQTSHVDFEADVQPILRQHCYVCHGSVTEEAGLNLAISDRAMQGGDSGAAITPGASQTSLLIQLISGSDPDRVMPPEGQRLSEAEIQTLCVWIDQGAAWPQDADVRDTKLDRARHHWAFRPSWSAKIPADKSLRSNTPIDRFIERKWRAAKLRPSQPLDAGRLVRRIYFDLIGLPPTIEQVDEFIADVGNDRQAAVENLVDELLASRHFGERWARHWLDVVRYADSDGQEADRDRPHAFRYRDFVIRAFNDDLPFDTFVRWQIAGDELEPKNADAVVATGFLTAGTHTVLGDSFLEEERLRNRYNELDDVVSTLGSAMLGLTVGCARCHDHKFDAISAMEYYQLLSAFHSGNRQSSELPNGEDGLFFQDFGREPKTTWLFGRGDFRNRDAEVTLGFPAVLLRGKTSSDYWEEALRELSIPSTGQRRALATWLTDVEHGAGMLLARVIVNRVWQHHFGHGLVRTTSDFGVRGEQPTHPELLEWLARDLIEHQWRLKRLHRMIICSAVYQQGVEFDQEMNSIDPANRLLWRRVPQRLEAEILRDAMLSVSGTLNEEPYGPGFKPMIPSEAILARNLQEGGYAKDAKDTHATRRRSVYMFHKRLVPYPLFQAFDRPDLLQSCARRENTTVAPQALALLNDRFVRACAEDFADLLMSETSAEDASQEKPTGDGNVDRRLIGIAFRRALGRHPSASEYAACLGFLQRQTAQRLERHEDDAKRAALADFCQSLFALNEFVYVD